jgi:hypothetical protein
MVTISCKICYKIIIVLLLVGIIFLSLDVHSFVYSKKSTPYYHLDLLRMEQKF